jgi:hypothetical protein
MLEKPTNTPIIHSVYQLCMVAPTCFGIALPSAGSVPSALWEMPNRGAVDRILWMGMLCPVTWCAYAISGPAEILTGRLREVQSVTASAKIKYLYDN